MSITNTHVDAYRSAGAIDMSYIQKQNSSIAACTDRLRRGFFSLIIMYLTPRLMCAFYRSLGIVVLVSVWTAEYKVITVDPASDP